MASAGTAFFPLLRAKDAREIVSRLAQKPRAARLAHLHREGYGGATLKSVPNLENREIRVASYFFNAPNKKSAEQSRQERIKNFTAEAKEARKEGDAKGAAKLLKWAKETPSAATLVRSAAAAMPIAQEAPTEGKAKEPLYVFYMGDGNVNSMASGMNDDFFEWILQLERANAKLKREKPKASMALLVAHGNRYASDDALPAAKFDIVPWESYNARGDKFRPNRPMRHTQLQKND